MADGAVDEACSFLAVIDGRSSLLLTVFWLDDPQLLEDPNLDVQTSEQGFGPDDMTASNIGFFLAQPTPMAVHLFETLFQWTTHRDPRLPRGFFCWDQALFDWALTKRSEQTLLRGCTRGATRANESYASVVAAFFNETAVRYQPISYELLPHPFKWNSAAPSALPREVIAHGGVIAVQCVLARGLDRIPR